MKIYTRKQVEDLIDKSRSEGRDWGKITLKDWCDKKGLYYHGVVRFLKGTDQNVNFYMRILKAADPAMCDPSTHYLATRLMYSDLSELQKFIKEINGK